MDIFACNDLTGKTIGGWTVGNQIASSDKTAKYALFYEVRNDAGSAIMKVLNYDKCHNFCSSIDKFYPLPAASIQNRGYNK